MCFGIFFFFFRLFTTLEVTDSGRLRWQGCLRSNSRVPILYFAVEFLYGAPKFLRKFKKSVACVVICSVLAPFGATFYSFFMDIEYIYIRIYIYIYIYMSLCLLQCVAECLQCVAVCRSGDHESVYTFMHRECIYIYKEKSARINIYTFTPEKMRERRESESESVYI